MSRFRGGGRRGRDVPVEGTGPPVRGRPSQNGVAVAGAAEQAAVAPKQVQLPNSANVAELAQLLGVMPAQVMKSLLQHGVVTNINNQLDYDTAKMVADDLNVLVVEPEEGAPGRMGRAAASPHRLVLEEEETSSPDRRW